MSEPDFDQDFLEDLSASEASWETFDDEAAEVASEFASELEADVSSEFDVTPTAASSTHVFTDVTLASPEPVTGVREFEVEDESAFAATQPTPLPPTRSESELDALLQSLMESDEGPLAEPTPPDLQQFWGLIDHVRQQIGHDPVRRVMSLRKTLTELSPEELIAFEHGFGSVMDAAYDWKLWAGGFILNGGLDADGFTDFRGWLISMGQRDYERVLADPELLVEVTVAESQTLLPAMVFLAEHVYEQNTGQPMPYPKARQWPMEPTGKTIDLDSDAALEAALPKLWSNFGWMN